MKDQKKKPIPPKEFAEQLIQSANGSGNFTNNGIPSNKKAIEAWKRVVSDMDKYNLSFTDKRDWMQKLLDEVKGTPGMTFAFNVEGKGNKRITGVLNRISERLRTVSDEIEKNQLYGNNYKDQHTVSGYQKEKELSPIEKIKLIEEIRKREGVDSYDEAISVANRESYTYKNYNSFKKARAEYKDFL